LPNGEAHGRICSVSQGGNLSLISQFDRGKNVISFEEVSSPNEYYYSSQVNQFMQLYYKTCRLVNNWLIARDARNLLVLRYVPKMIQIVTGKCHCGYYHHFRLWKQPITVELIRKCPNTKSTRYAPFTITRCEYGNLSPSKTLFSFRTKVVMFSKTFKEYPPDLVSKTKKVN
jgi:hypothetical protein